MRIALRLRHSDGWIWAARKGWNIASDTEACLLGPNFDKPYFQALTIISIVCNFCFAIRQMRFESLKH